MGNLSTKAGNGLPGLRLYDWRFSGVNPLKYERNSMSYYRIYVHWDTYTVDTVLSPFGRKYWLLDYRGKKDHYNGNLTMRDYLECYGIV